MITYNNNHVIYDLTDGIAAAHATDNVHSLIQDLEFQGSSSRLIASHDGRYLFAAGAYPPQVKCFEVEQLGIKFDVHVESDIVDMALLGDDHTKYCCLGSNRTIFFYAKYGAHASIRIPSMGRAMYYDRFSCDLHVVASSSQLFSFNMNHGTFNAPVQTSHAAFNVLDMAPSLCLMAYGSDQGYVECRDCRQPESALGTLDVIAPLIESGDIGRGQREQITALKFCKDGFSLLTGTSGGIVAEFDIRMSAPLCVIDHRWGLPIKSLQDLGSDGLAMSACGKSVRVWRKGSGDHVISTETRSVCNDAYVWPDSGLILTAGEDPKMGAYYMPVVGKSPNWCSFLDVVTEEMEQDAQERNEVFEEHTFVTPEELTKIDGDDLIGTAALRPYMHGYFLQTRLYKRLRAIANPYEHQAFRKQQIKDKVEAKRASRITAPRAPQVSDVVPEGDDRFSELFTNPRFGGGNAKQTQPRQKRKKKKATAEQLANMSGFLDKVGKGKEKMYEASAPEAMGALLRGDMDALESGKKRRNLKLGDRAKELASKRHVPLGNQIVSELSFIPNAVKQKKVERKQKSDSRHERNQTRRKVTRSSLFSK